MTTRIFNRNYAILNSYNSVVASSEIATLPVENVENFQRRTKPWRSTGSTSENILWDLGLEANPKALIIAGDRNKPIKLTEGVTITLEGNETSNFTSPSFSTTLSYHPNIIYKVSNTGLHTEPLRYWKLKFEDNLNPLGYIDIGLIYLGDFITLDRGAIQIPFRSNYVDYSTTIYTQSGQSFSDLRENSESFEAAWFGLTKADRETIDRFWSLHQTNEAFFIQIDSNSVIGTESEDFFRLVKIGDAPKWSLESPGNFSMEMTLREQL